MYWLIEDIDKINFFCKIKYIEAFVEIIPISPTLHPTQNSISAMYVKPLDGTKGYIIPINHNDTLNLDESVIEEVLNSIGKIYVRDKKQFLHFAYHTHCCQPPPSPHPYIPKLTECHEFYNKTYKSYTNLNTIIPIVKHYQICEDIFNNFDFTHTNEFYNNKASIVFNKIEQSPIKLDTARFAHYFNIPTDGYAYTNYNLNTLTTRPSNTFGGINFSTLNKDNNERECFVPNNDYFIELDISSYHPTLLSHILRYTFPSDDIHSYFAEIYGVEYAKAKEITFQQIYGGIFKQYEHIEFFKLTKQYVNKIWEEYMLNGEITCDISGYKFDSKNLTDMNPQKLLNYILQERETSTNVRILWDIFKALRGKNTKLVLTVYDSFLFDVDNSELETIEHIRNIFTKYKLQTKTKQGINYNLKQ